MPTEGLTGASGSVDLDNTSFELICGKCRACCYGVDGPRIEVHEVADYECHYSEEEGVWRLDQKEGPLPGECGYLGEEGCTIYETRPQVCRTFDCRSLVLKVDADKLDQSVADGTILAEVVQQGRIRLMQFNKSLESQAFAEIFLGKDSVEDDPYHNLGDNDG